MRCGSSVVCSLGLALFVVGCVGKAADAEQVVDAPDPKPEVKAPKPVPQVVTQMFDAYSKLMNDEALIESGVFGVSRMGPQDPGFLHRNVKRGATPPTKNAGGYALQRPKEIHAIRNQAAKAGQGMGDGLIRLRDADVIFWHGTVGEKSQAYAIRARQEVEKAAEEGIAALNTNPNEPYVKELTNAMLYLKPIKFESKSCVSCHPGTKVGDTAALSAVLIAKKQAPRQNPGAKTVPLPKNFSAEFGVSQYPGTKPLMHSRRINTTLYDVCQVNLETKDSIDTVLKYYMDELAKKPSIALGKQNDRFSFLMPTGPKNKYINYEFGDRHYGQVRLRASNGVTHIQLGMHIANAK